MENKNKNEMMVFSNEVFGEVRAFDNDGQIWFVASDVAKLLDYKDQYDMTRNLDDDETDTVKFLDINNRPHNYTTIDKIALHKILSSTRKVSKENKRKIFDWLTNKDFYFTISKGVKEIEFLRKLEVALSPFGITGKKQHSILDYKIDYYIPSLNVAIEYDENGHKNYTYEAHELRQELIEKELGCRFIRVTDKKNDEFNIGLVIKELFNIK